MSDISLSIGWLDVLAFALFTGAPGIGFGALCGALAARRQHVAGGAIGAVVGWLVAIAGFAAWRDSRASINHDYWNMVGIETVHALPGLVAGAMLGAWLRREAQMQGAVWGGLAGAGVALAGWWGLGRAF